MRFFGNLFGFTGRLGRLGYWAALIGLLVGFLCLAIAFPAFVILILPFGYLGFCLLANRLRDAGLPAVLALTPFAFFVSTAMLYMATCVLTIGGGGSGTGGSPGMTKLYHALNDHIDEAVLWTFALTYFVAGCLPTRSRLPRICNVQPLASAASSSNPDWLTALTNPGSQ